MNNIEFGNYLKKLREKRGLSTHQVELRSTVSNSYISLIERGLRSFPSPKTLRKLAPVYRVAYEELLYHANYIESPRTIVYNNNPEKVHVIKQEKDICKLLKEIIARIRHEKGLLYNEMLIKDSTIKFLIQSLNMIIVVANTINKSKDTYTKSDWSWWHENVLYNFNYCYTLIFVIRIYRLYQY